MFNVGTYSLAPVKVVWRRMTIPLEATVVADDGPNPPLPQETLCFIPCSELGEAFYYAGLLNSAVVNAAALATSQGGAKSFGAPHLLKLVRLPKFDSNSMLHRLLAEAAKSAACGDTNDSEVDSAAAAVYGFSADETELLIGERDFLLSRK